MICWSNHRVKMAKFLHNWSTWSALPDKLTWSILTKGWVGAFIARLISNLSCGFNNSIWSFAGETHCTVNCLVFATSSFFVSKELDFFCNGNVSKLPVKCPYVKMDENSSLKLNCKRIKVRMEKIDEGCWNGMRWMRQAGVNVSCSFITGSFSFGYRWLARVWSKSMTYSRLPVSIEGLSTTFIRQL